MAKNQQYRPLSGDEENDGEEKGFRMNEKTEKNRSYWSSIAMCALMVSFSINVLLVVGIARFRDASQDHGRTRYSR